MGRRIDDEIREDLFHENEVGFHERQSGGDETLDGMRRDEGFEVAQRDAHEFGNVAPIEPRPELSGLQPRGVEKTLNNAIESRAGGFNFAEEIQLMSRERLHAEAVG